MGTRKFCHSCHTPRLWAPFWLILAAFAPTHLCTTCGAAIQPTQREQAANRRQIGDTFGTSSRKRRREGADE